MIIQKKLCFLYRLRARMSYSSVFDHLPKNVRYVEEATRDANIVN